MNIESGPMVGPPRTKKYILPKQFNQALRPNLCAKTIRHPCWIFAPIRYPPSCFGLKLPVDQSIFPIYLNYINLTIRVPSQFILFFQTPQPKPNTYQKKHSLPQSFRTVLPLYTLLPQYLLMFFQDRIPLRPSAVLSFITLSNVFLTALNAPDTNLLVNAITRSFQDHSKL